MASKFERAASLVQDSIEKYGENGDYHTIIGILRDCHDSVQDQDATIDDLREAIVDRVMNTYVSESISFDTPPAE